MRLIRVPRKEFLDHATYYVETTDMDSKDVPVLIKLWDTYEIPIGIMADCFAMELNHRHKTQLKPRKEFNRIS